LVTYFGSCLFNLYMMIGGNAKMAQRGETMQWRT